ncbi:hypothetical protein EON80_07635, partial [bacterium]
VRDFEAMGDKTAVTLLNEENLNGRSVKKVQLETHNDYETTKIILLIDSETDLPLRADMTVRTRYGQEMKGGFEFQFNQSLSANLFEPKFSRNARFLDLQKQEGELKQRLAKGLASHRAGERTITIRDLQVNQRGAVFTVYTAGKRIGDAFSDGENRLAGRDWKITLTDSLGTTYEPIDPRNYSLNMFKPHSFDGQRLELDWWIPKEASTVGQTWRPRTFTLKFELNPKNLHGLYSSSKKFPGDYSLKTDFKVPVSSPSAPLLPPTIQALDSGLSEQTISVFEARTRGDLPPGIQPSSELVRAIVDGGEEWNFSFSPDGRIMASSGKNGIHLWDMASGQQLRGLQLSLPIGYEPVEAPLFSPDGKHLVVAFEDRRQDSAAQSITKILTWDVASGKRLAGWEMPVSADLNLRGLVFSPDGSTLRLLSSIMTRKSSKEHFFISQNGIAQEFDALTGRSLESHVLPHQSYITSGLVENNDSNGWQIVTIQGKGESQTRLMRLWNGSSGELQQTVPMPENFFSDTVAFNNAGNGLIAVAGTHYQMEGNVQKLGEKEIQLFEASSGKLLRSLNPASIPGLTSIGTLAFSRDGSQLACQSDDFTLKIWDTASGRVTRTLVGHYSQIRRIEFASDGKSLASLDAKGKLLQWRLN